MVCFLMWFLISNYKLISAEVVYLEASRSLCYEGIGLQSTLGFDFDVILQGFMLIHQLQILTPFGDVINSPP